jgi:hypothetical protein
MHKNAPDPIHIIKQATGEKPTKCGRHNHLSTVHICNFFEDSFDLLNIQLEFVSVTIVLDVIVLKAHAIKTLFFPVK